MEGLARAIGFEWDEWNADKIWEKHQVSHAECEQVLFSEPSIVAEDAEHSKAEPRYYVLGVTEQGRKLFLVFTLRRTLIRVITARDMSRKERRIYRNVEEEGGTQV